MKDILILGIETSCDETSAAVVKNGREVLSNVVSSQIEIHKRFGGVVPEVASRNHLMAITSVVNEALEKAGIKKEQINAIAVTSGPGLIGALMVGVSFAKTLSYSLNIPLISVNHIKGHVAAGYISDKNLEPQFYALIVSGGHTMIAEIKTYIKHKVLISTTDDAIGEAYDKAARVLGLSYPGGPNLEKLAAEGKLLEDFNYKLNLKNLKSFSFSGLKTAVINYVNNAQMKNKEINSADVAYTFQKYAIAQVAEVSAKIAKNKTLVVCGGVSANNALREELAKKAKENKINLIIPPLNLCTDNAAMIAAEGYFNFINNKKIASLSLGARSTLDF